VPGSKATGSGPSLPAPAREPQATARTAGQRDRANHEGSATRSRSQRDRRWYCNGNATAVGIAMETRRLECLGSGVLVEGRVAAGGRVAGAGEGRRVYMVWHGKACRGLHIVSLAGTFLRHFFTSRLSFAKTRRTESTAAGKQWQAPGSVPVSLEPALGTPLPVRPAAQAHHRAEPNSQRAGHAAVSSGWN
jgi:hypothetical protein